MLIFIGIILVILAGLGLLPALMSFMCFDAGPNPVAIALFLGIWGFEFLTLFDGLYLIIKGIIRIFS